MHASRRRHGRAQARSYEKLLRHEALAGAGLPATGAQRLLFLSWRPARCAFVPRPWNTDHRAQARSCVGASLLATGDLLATPDPAIVGIALRPEVAASDGALAARAAMLAGMKGMPGHRALRKGRHSQPGGIYLVTFTTVARRPLFSDFRAAWAASRTFEPSAAAEGAALLCWVLMPDHFHGLLRLDGAKNLSPAIRRIKSRSSHACACAGTAQPVWARAFHDHALRRNEDVLGTARYIIANPIRAGIVECVREYPFWNAVWL